MQPGDFDYTLPDELIAQAPLPERSTSRLLHLEPGGALHDLAFTALGNLLDSGDLLVLNDTRVLPARLFGEKDSGGRVEMLLERQLEPTLVLAQLRFSRAPGPGRALHFEGGATAEIIDRTGRFFVLRFDRPVTPFLESHGHMPLPPYIQRPDVPEDRARYQTVYARVPGAVAAPTAGLHFDRGQLNRLRSKGVEIAFLTLHVGAGTFAPLDAAQLDSGRLHAERVTVTPGLCDAARAARARGSRVVAVGTTVVRALEAASASGAMEPIDGETDLFIRPGYEFRTVDALLTNFHLPRSSLLMLVCAFAGTGPVLAAYRHAVSERYRFFSYGDAMFCHRAAPSPS